jgi:hypothetical protein
MSSVTSAKTTPTAAAPMRAVSPLAARDANAQQDAKPLEAPRAAAAETDEDLALPAKCHRSEGPPRDATTSKLPSRDTDNLRLHDVRVGAPNGVARRVVLPASLHSKQRFSRRRVPDIGMEDAQTTHRRRIGGPPAHCFGGVIVLPEDPPKAQGRARTPLADGRAGSAPNRCLTAERRRVDVSVDAPVSGSTTTSTSFAEPNRLDDFVPRLQRRRGASAALAHHGRQPENRIADPRKFRKSTASVWGCHRPADHDIFGARTPWPPNGSDGLRASAGAAASAGSARARSHLAQRARVALTGKVTAVSLPRMPTVTERSAVQPQSASAPRKPITHGAPRIPGSGGVLAKLVDADDVALRSRKAAAPAIGGPPSVGNANASVGILPRSRSPTWTSVGVASALSWA